MLSRVANSIHWMGRYIERAENVARFVDVNLHLALDLPPGAREQWQPLIAVTGDDELFAERYGMATRERVIEFLTFDRENPNSILSCLAAARENARTVREIISSEMWEQINRAHLAIQSAAPRWRELDMASFYAEAKTAAHLFTGIADATMSHGEAWHFLRLGRLIERADKTSRILDVKYFILLPMLTDVGTPFDNIQWAALLKSASALEMYRKRHRAIAPERVAQFLILDHEFPRSIRWCLGRAQRSLHEITGAPPGAPASLSGQRMGRLLAELMFTTIEEIVRGGLHEYLDRLQLRLNEVGQAIHSDFFALRPLGPGH